MRSSPAKRPLPVSEDDDERAQLHEVLVHDQVAALGRDRVEVADERRGCRGRTAG